MDFYKPSFAFKINGIDVSRLLLIVSDIHMHIGQTFIFPTPTTYIFRLHPEYQAAQQYTAISFQKENSRHEIGPNAMFQPVHYAAIL